MLNKTARHEWLIREVERRRAVDVLNESFVDDFITRTDAKYLPTMFGAFGCPTLGRDLRALYLEGWMRRERVGISGMAGMGFPRWVWSYRLTPSGEARAAMLEADA